MNSVGIKIWPPKQCQACLSTDIEHVYHEEHEGATDWAYCRTCNAYQEYWFENVDEVSTYCKDCGKPTKPGKGSARCPECWEDRCGYNIDEQYKLGE
jgi:hypothetical protein